MWPYIEVLDPLDFGLVKGDKYRSNCILPFASIQFDKNHLLKMVCFYPVCTFGFFVKKIKENDYVTLGVLKYIDIFNSISLTNIADLC